MTWIADRGRPAVAAPMAGMPAYESETGALKVMETVLAFTNPEGERYFLPVGWGRAACRAPSGFVALHDGADAVWSWRPIIYRQHSPNEMNHIGSQGELEWRWGLRTALVADHLGRPDEREEANRRARTLLLEHLNAQQRLELAGHGFFHLIGPEWEDMERGGRLLWRIRPGNGAAIVDPWTWEECLAVCLHPEEWLPDDDVALATKLLIESGIEGERAALDAGRVRTVGRFRVRKRRPRTRVTGTQNEAWHMHKELLVS